MTLPEPHFIDRDAAAITADMIAAYEDATGRPLQPAQVERLIINLQAYRENLIRIGIQEAAKQNLLAFARFPMIDYLGELLGVSRLPQSPSVTTLRFSLAAAQELPAIVPAGTRARSGDGRFTFASDRLAQVPAGSLFVDVPATAAEVGAAGNGYAPGQVAQLLDPVAPVVAVTNVSETHGGRDTEDDDRLRERIREAPEKFSVAGPYGAYRWHAKADLWRFYDGLADFLATELSLRLNRKTSVFPAARGIDFCGYRVWTTHVLPRKRNVKKARRKFRHLAAQYHRGLMTFEEIRPYVTSFTGYMKHCQSRRTVETMLDEFVLIPARRERKDHE